MLSGMGTSQGTIELNQIEFTNMSFRFDDKTHTYWYDGQRMTGVTTVLGVIAKPMLIGWAANQTADYILEHSSKEGLDSNGVLLVEPQVIEDARTAHTRTRDRRASEGTGTHKLVEDHVKSCIANGGEAAPHQTDDHQLYQFVDWAVTNKVTFLESEKVMYHPDWFVGGTTDLLFVIGGKKYIADVKTSKAVYYEAHVQMAAYRAMLENMGEGDIHGSVIIHLPPSGTLQTYYHFDFETNLSVFMAALTIYRAKQMYDGMESDQKKEKKQLKLTK